MGKPSVVIVGSGNVAYHLGQALKKASCSILQVYSRNQSGASPLAALLKAEPVSDIWSICKGADLYVLAISDDAIRPMTYDLKLTTELVVHTSGTTGMHVLNDVSENVGVIYPLQTFSKEKQVEMRSVPIFIEANNNSNLRFLHKVATSISDKVIRLDSNKRRMVHLAAVFACNFTNLMYAEAERIVESEGVDFEVLKPLILETANKTRNMRAVDAQTGPAARGDQKIISEHLKLLQGRPEMQEIYQKLSDEIKRNSNKEDNTSK